MKETKRTSMRRIFWLTAFVLVWNWLMPTSAEWHGLLNSLLRHHEDPSKSATPRHVLPSSDLGDEGASDTRDEPR
jgi:hypothetical protein